VVNSKTNQNKTHNFLQRLPHNVVSSGMTGVFYVTPPPETFDPMTVSRTELIRHGIYIPRPRRGDPHYQTEIWNKVFSKKRNGSEIEMPSILKSGGEYLLKKRRSAFDHASSHWSGCEVSGSWNAVYGGWKIPAVRPGRPNSSNSWKSSSWVGIDGTGTISELLQAGIEQDVKSEGTPNYWAWFEWLSPFWMSNIVASSSQRYSIASFNGILYIAWTSYDNHLNLAFSTTNQLQFGGNYFSNETSTAGPVICVHNNQLYIAWKGNGNDNLNVAVVDMDAEGNISGFSNKNTLGETSPFAPALTSFNQNLYLSWTGDNNNQLNVIVSSDNGQNFKYKFVSGQTSYDSPCLAVHNDDLYIAWTDSVTIKVTIVDVAINQTTHSITGFGDYQGSSVAFSNSSPSLASLNSRLYLLWKESYNDKLSMAVSIDDGITFINENRSDIQSSCPPGFTIHDGYLFIVWTDSTMAVGTPHVSPVGIQEQVNSIDLLALPDYISPIKIGIKVEPGDNVYCAVHYLIINDRKYGMIYFVKEEGNEPLFSLMLLPPPGCKSPGNSVEWIMEVPSMVSDPADYLPSFDPLQFSLALGCGANNAIALPENGEALNIYDYGMPPVTSVNLDSTSLSINYIG
jgi:Peptidase A4 family